MPCSAVTFSPAFVILKQCIGMKANLDPPSCLDLSWVCFKLTCCFQRCVYKCVFEADVIFLLQSAVSLACIRLFSLLLCLSLSTFLLPIFLDRHTL